MVLHRVNACLGNFIMSSTEKEPIHVTHAILYFISDPLINCLSWSISKCLSFEFFNFMFLLFRSQSRVSCVLWIARRRKSASLKSLPDNCATVLCHKTGLAGPSLQDGKEITGQRIVQLLCLNHILEQHFLFYPAVPVWDPHFTLHINTNYRTGNRTVVHAAFFHLLISTTPLQS